MCESLSIVIMLAIFGFYKGVASSTIEDYKCVIVDIKTHHNKVTLKTTLNGCNHFVQQMEICATNQLQCRSLCWYMFSNNLCESNHSYGPVCDCTGGTMTMIYQINSSYEIFRLRLVSHDSQILTLQNIIVDLRESSTTGTTGFKDREKATEAFSSPDISNTEFYSEGQKGEIHERVSKLSTTTPVFDSPLKSQDSDTFVTQDKVVFISGGMSALTMLVIFAVGILIIRCWRRKRRKVKALKKDSASLPPTPHHVRGVRETDTLVEMLARQLQLPVRDLMLRRGPGRDRHSRTQSIPSTVVTGGYEQINEELLDQLQQSAADLYSRYSASAYTDYTAAASLLMSPTPSGTTSYGQPAPNHFAFPPPCGSVAYPTSPRTPWVPYPWSWLSARAAGYPGYSAHHDYHNVPVTKRCSPDATASPDVQSSDGQSRRASLDSDRDSDVREDTAPVYQSYENINC